MARIRLFASLLALCLIQMCLAGRIQRDSSDSSSSQESKESSEITWTADEIAQYNAINDTATDSYWKERLSGGVSFELFLKLWKAYESSKSKELTQAEGYAVYCDILDPDSSANKLPLPADGDKHLAKLDDASDFLPGVESNPLVKNVICPYIRNPEFDADYAKSMGFARHQYHKMQDIRRRNSDKSVSGRVSVARKLCKVFQESEIFADISKSPKELSEEQLTSFDELLALANSSSDSSRAQKYRDVCSFLGETVSPNEQAESLKIPVDLYNKIVVIRKEYGDYLEIWNRIKAWTRVCKEIDESDGHSDKTYLDEVAIGLPREKEFLILIRKSFSVKASKKVGKWREACEHLFAEDGKVQQAE